MKSATKKLSTEIAETLTGKIESVVAGSKKIKKSIEKAAAKLAKKVAKFEKETLKEKAKEAKKAKGEGKKDKKKLSKEDKLAALVASASSKPPVATPAKVTLNTPAVSAKPASAAGSAGIKRAPKNAGAEPSASENPGAAE